MNSDKMTIIDKPWGREQILERNDNYVLKLLTVLPGQRLSLQYHEIKVETMLCLSGDGFLAITRHDTGESMDYTMTPGKYITVNPFDVHRLCAGKNDLVIIETSSTELDDVVRLEDDYDR